MLALGLAACATTEAGPNGLSDRDPHEEFNREIFAANMAVDRAVVRPVADVYRGVAPNPVRQGVTNFFENLREPWSFVNNVLQASPGRALRNLGRFLINSTVGLGGLIDVASAIGIEPAPEDFDQTLAVWGVGDGGYRVVPILGPTTGRGLIGQIVDFLANPTTLFLSREANFSTGELWALRSFDLVNARANARDAGVDGFIESSADPYAAVRSAYFQRREAEILNYDTAGLDSGEDIGDSNAEFERAFDELEADQPDAEAPPEATETPDGAEQPAGDDELLWGDPGFEDQPVPQ